MNEHINTVVNISQS